MVETGREKSWEGREAGHSVAISFPSLLPVPPTGGSHGVSGQVQAGTVFLAPASPPALLSPRKSLPQHFRGTSSPPSSLPPTPRVAFYRRTLLFDYPRRRFSLPFPRPTLPRGLYGRPPPWVAQNGERGAAQDGGAASLCSVRFRFLLSGRLLSLRRAKTGGGAECEPSWGRQAGEAGAWVGESAVSW